MYSYLQSMKEKKSVSKSPEAYQEERQIHEACGTTK
jgi:hypothetical protein